MSQSNARVFHTVSCLLAVSLIFQSGCRPTTPPPEESQAPQVTQTPGSAPSLETPTPTAKPTPEAPPKPEKFEISAQPFASTAGRPLDPPPAVRVMDSSGRPVPNIAVDVAISKNAFADSSEKQAITNAEGLAVFNNLVVERAESFYQLEFSSAGFQPIRSAEFNVRFAAPRSMAITVQPVASRKGKSIGGPPTVRLVDSFGNPVPRVAVEVRLQEPTKAALAGTARVLTDQNGEAKFENLSLKVAAPKAILMFDAKAAGVPDQPSEPFGVR